MSARHALWWIYRLPRLVMLGFIRGWRALISPLYGQTCKYYPSCSAYGLAAVERHGAVRGGAMTVWRILRCNPFSHGGVDEVPPTELRLGLSRWLAGAEPASQPTSRTTSGATDLTPQRCAQERPKPNRAHHRAA